ncbi:Sideroflexin-1 like protein [Argiope bruennichi]|uniref:Sideroflexin-1 like protein n=1 Tax=Argiope bruennichi TaxID=94029 RepID=A0A8T0FHC9_ARGBR|nr:Sideroflexin-1 like protein [Argiope bruennichi]
MSQININEPRWDQNTYWGRAKHFFTTTNPLNLFCSSSELEKAKDIVTQCRKGEKVNLSEDEIWRAKHLYDSAFHPDTGEKMILIGRMSAQVPMNMTITGCMLAFYKTTPQVVFWQWINQSFNAVVNYTNRSGDSPIPVKPESRNYRTDTAPPLVGRFVPFCAVAAANCVNIPMMRLKEIREGIPVVDKNGNRVGNSKTAAKWAITQVVLSRIGMAMPGMLIPPFIMNHLDKKGVLKKYPWVNAPLQVGLCGLFLVFATPLCCALFPQQSSISIDALEPEIRDAASQLKIEDKCLFYNKGL